jgi:GNAT superfamily N-acetyltransferase
MAGPLSGTTHLRKPLACTDDELREFARLVHQGFEPVRENLDGRIRDAKWLGFYYEEGDGLSAVAALKAPDEQYRCDVFKKADATGSPADYKLELGWIFVVPTHRGNRIAGNLCEQLLAREPGFCVFATTRTDNTTMKRILLALGFARAGKPYQRGDGELVLFLRS